jgi:hypothetical protein
MTRLLTTYVTAATMLTTTRDRLTNRVSNDDRGSLTMEQAVIGAALFAAAAVLIAVIARVVADRAGQIG